jgi:hypothetical protein
VPALEAGFVSWDDVPMLVAETGYRGLGPRPLGWMLTSTVMGHWSPLAWLSFSVDYTVGGLDPRVFHATSLGCTPSTPRWSAWSRDGSSPSRGGSPPGDDGRGRATAVDAGALGAALLFALHPLRAETVAWISDRRDLLCATFVLLAVWAYLRGIADAGRLRGGWRLASLAAFAAALASKGIAVTVPALLLLLDWYPLRRGSDGWRALVREKAPYAGLALGAGVATALALRASAAVADYTQYGPLSRLTLVGYALWIHPARLAWPAGLSPLYELPAEMSWRDPRFLTPALAALAVTSGLLALRHRWPAGISAWAVSLILLGPVSGVVLAGRHVAADRYTYLSGLGLTLLAAGGLVAVPVRADRGHACGGGRARSVAAGDPGHAGLAPDGLLARLGAALAARGRGGPELRRVPQQSGAGPHALRSGPAPWRRRTCRGRGPAAPGDSAPARAARPVSESRCPPRHGGTLGGGRDGVRRGGPAVARQRRRPRGPGRRPGGGGRPCRGGDPAPPGGRPSSPGMWRPRSR